MLVSSDCSHTVGDCIITPHTSSHKHELDQDNEDDGTSPQGSSPTHASSCHSTCTSSSQSDHHGDIYECDEPEAHFEISGAGTGVEKVTAASEHGPASDELDHAHQKDGVVVHQKVVEGERIQALVIQLPRAILLGIDIDMVLPVVSYIQPYSPLRQHVAVGDILIHINGHSVLDLTHMELCSMINGVSKNKSESDEIEMQRKWTKLVFLPAKYRRNLQKRDAMTKAKTMQSNREQKSAKSCSPIQDKGIVEEKLDRIGESSEQTDEVTSATSLVDRSYEQDRNRVGQSNPSLVDEVQPHQDQCREEDVSSNSKNPSVLYTPTSKQLTVNDGNHLPTPIPSSPFKRSITDCSPIIATARASLSDDERRDSYYVTAKKENDDIDISRSLRDIPLDHLEKKFEEKNDKNQTALDFSSQKESGRVDDIHQPTSVAENHCIIEEPERNILRDKLEEYKEEKHSTNAVRRNDVVTESKIIQDDALDDRDRRRLERKNRPQPAIEFLSIPTDPDSMEDVSTLYGGVWTDHRDRRRLERKNRPQPKIEFLSIQADLDSMEDVSTLFGGVWNKQLHHAAHRVEDNMVDHMEKGVTRQNTGTNGCTKKRQIRGVNSHKYHADKRTGDKDSSHFTDVMIEITLVSVCILSVTGLIAFLVVVVLR